MKLIPLWGMCGAAAATLISYLLYFALLLFVVWRSIGVTPFSTNQLKVLLVVAVMLVLNFLWVRYLSGYFHAEASKAAFFGESVLRTCLLCVVGMVMVYVSKLSKEVNGLMDKYILKRLKN